MEKKLEEPKVIDLTTDESYAEIVPGAAYRKHAFGKNFSVALFKIPKGKGGEFPRDFHRHSEEIGIQLKGTSKVFACGKEYVVEEGQAILIPEGLEHAGIFGEEECLLLAIASPPRKDYGPENW